MGTTSAVRVRALGFDDIDRALSLNRAEVPHVGEVTRERLLALFAWSDVAIGADRDGDLVGFLIAFGPRTRYDSPNYRWFVDRHADFLYVDRIVVAEEARRAGVASALYDAALEAWPAPLLTAEVNVEPPNPGSMAFHERHGFAEVARVEHGPGKIVAMLAKGTGYVRPEG